MEIAVVMAGFGGQGLMMIGKLLAQAGLAEGKEVTWLPSYGPEMRGGTANCTVVLSDHPIGSPLTASPAAAVVMNLPSMEKFAPMVRSQGLLVVNSTMVPAETDRQDIRSFRIAADEIATELGSRRSANLVMLGAYVGLDEVVSRDTLLQLIEEAFSDKEEFLEVNRKAFLAGYEKARARMVDA